MSGVMEKLFLRFYAANLERIRRNDARTACSDAISQMAALGGIAATSVYSAMGALVSPGFRAALSTGTPVFIATCAIVGGIGGYWVGRGYRSYRERPEAADPYRSRNAVRIINVLYVVVPIAWAWSLGLTLRFLS